MRPETPRSDAENLLKLRDKGRTPVLGELGEVKLAPFHGGKIRGGRQS
jgi:hypothetical protein